MKFIPLILRNVLRNKIRTFFTGSSIAMSLFLVVLLYSFLTIQDEIAASAAGYNRIVATHVNGLTGNVPIAFLDPIRAISGVRNATPFSWFGGKYREETIPFAQFGVDANYIMDLLELLNTQFGTTIIMVTHDPKAARRAKRLLHLEKGTFVQADTQALEAWR